MFVIWDSKKMGGGFDLPIYTSHNNGKLTMLHQLAHVSTMRKSTQVKITPSDFAKGPLTCPMESHAVLCMIA